MQLLVAICAASAGVHGVLAPAHFRESLSLGMGFAVAAAALAAVAIGLDRRPQSRTAIHAVLIEAVGLLLAIKPINEPVASRKLVVAAEKGVLS